jgi:hypothetical protein
MLIQQDAEGKLPIGDRAPDSIAHRSWKRGYLLTITWLLGNDGKHLSAPAQPLFCQKSAIDGLIGQAATQRLLHCYALNQVLRL